MNASNLGISVGLTMFPTVQLQHCNIMISYLVKYFHQLWPEDLASAPLHRTPLAISVSSTEGSDHLRYY